MNINHIQPAMQLNTVSATPAQATQQFSQYLEQALEQVGAEEQQVHDLNHQFILGNVNVDELMIASEKAALSLQLTTQLRNKVIEAYQEIMRMQM